MPKSHLGSDLEIRNWCMELADRLIPKVKNILATEKGKNLRYLSVQNVDVEYVMDNEVHQINTEVHYLSEDEDFYQPLIIRYFDSVYSYTLEKTQYERLLARTKVFPNIEPVDILLADEKEQVIIYKAPNGVHLNDLGLEDEHYYYQLGYLLGILHSGETSPLNITDYRSISLYLVNNLPFSNENKKLISESIVSEFEILKNSRAGYEPVFLIDLFHIQFIPLDDQITKTKIMAGEAMYIELLPSLVTNLQMDRMEDFATLFAEKGFIEFQSTGKIDETVMSIVACMEGYEGYFEQYSTAPMDRIYPKGLSLDLHMLLSIWLIALNLIQEGEVVNPGILTDYTLFVLENNPYQIYG